MNSVALWQQSLAHIKMSFLQNCYYLSSSINHIARIILYYSTCSQFLHVHRHRKILRRGGGGVVV